MSSAMDPKADDANMTDNNGNGGDNDDATRNKLYDTRRWRETQRRKFTPKQKNWQKMTRDITEYKKVGHSVTFMYCLHDSVRC